VDYNAAKKGQQHPEHVSSGYFDSVIFAGIERHPHARVINRRIPE
jgi:hypothetical protein